MLNGSPLEAGKKPACAGVTPGAIPEVEAIQKADTYRSGAKRGSIRPDGDARLLGGAEKKYPYDAAKMWFVLRAGSGKLLEAVAAIDSEILFVPFINVVEKKNGKRVTIEKPLINNLLFVYATKSMADEYINGKAALPFLAYQYDHCNKNEYGRSVPMVIAYNEMVNFINATSTDETDVRIVDESKVIHYKSNDIVEITTGKFKGVRGRVARLAGHQRVVVELKGILNFATTYIPNSWLKKTE